MAQTQGPVAQGTQGPVAQGTQKPNILYASRDVIQALKTPGGKAIIRQNQKTNWLGLKALDKELEQTTAGTYRTLQGIGRGLQGAGDKIQSGIDSMGKGIIPTGKGIIPTGKGIFQHISSNIAYRIIFMFLFFFVFYKIIYRICIFFGIDQIILSMYMGWVSFIIVLFTFLPHDYGNILDE